MMIDLEQLKADREAGAGGHWLAIKYFGDKDGWFVRSYGQKSICGKGSIGLSEANARRIARLPELEAAYIEVVAKLDKAVEALGEVDDTLAKLSGSLAELDAALLAQEIAVIALERDNIAALITAKPERDE